MKYKIVNRAAANSIMTELEINFINQRGALEEIVGEEGYVPVSQWTDEAIIDSVIFYEVTSELLSKGIIKEAI
jgi:hypothetical protein